MTEADSRATISQRRQLVRRYPANKTGLEAWRSELSTVKTACLRRLNLPAQAKQVSEARQAIGYRLTDALERMTRIMPMLPPKFRKEAATLLKKLDSLRAEIEAVHLSAARKLRNRK
ncbi:MAG: hypothetical protein ABSE73_12825 [Planctomycetota bacterium]